MLDVNRKKNLCYLSKFIMFIGKFWQGTYILHTATYRSTNKKMFFIKVWSLYTYRNNISAQICAKTNAFLLLFQKSSSFSQSYWKNTHFYKPLKWPLFQIFCIYFYFLSFVGTPMNNCAKYQHPKQKFKKKFLLIFFNTFFEGLKNSHYKEKNFKIVFLCFRT